jgi:4-hydroxythreonine-4-phosphate dehydrogenase
MPSSKPAEPRAPIDISMGDPSGIGPEIAVKAWAKLDGRIGGRKLRFVGSAAVFRDACKWAGIAPDVIISSILETAHNPSAEPGKPDGKNAGAIIAAITVGTRNALSGESAALVTAPIHKAILTESGFPFPGHTEYLAELTGARRAVMMLAGPDLRVVPLTVHVPLAEVPKHLDTGAIVETGEIVLAALVGDFGIAHPRLAVAGLNPHAGEEGTMGREDRTIIAPAIQKLKARGHEVIGPLSADTLFHADARARYDAALCMYHDQALIPIKALHFEDAVNVTLGLPIVRTAPDHGTAFDIAGQDRADPRPMAAAIRMAAENAVFRAEAA